MRTSTPVSSATETRSAFGRAASAGASPFAVSRLWEGSAGAAAPNALTCDVEDYFHVGAFETVISKSRWNDLECRVPRNIDRILQMLSDARVHGTFFTL